MKTLKPKDSLRVFTEGDLYQCNEEFANLYEDDADFDYTVIGQLRDGESVVILDEVAGFYLKVLTPLGIGWVHYTDISGRI